MQSPTGIIPDELFTHASRNEVIAFLLTLPVHGEDKVSLFMGWCSWMNTRILPKERTQLNASGI